MLHKLSIDPDVHTVISVVGAGGKSSLILQLRDELCALGKRVIVTTSTHIAYDKSLPWAGTEESAASVKAALSEYGYCYAGVPVMHKSGIVKAASPGPDEALRLRELCDVLLIEADGARRCPVKVPAEWEPVIWSFTEMVIGVLGADAIGHKICDAAYRPEDLAEFLGKSVSDTLTADDICDIASSDKGLRKQTGELPFRFFLNKVDSFSGRTAAALKICAKLREMGIDALFGSLQGLGDMACILMAAGQGIRFGSNKLLYETGGMPVIEHVLSQIAGIDGIALSAVYSDDRVEKICRRYGAHTILNDAPELGASRSLRLGLSDNIGAGSVLCIAADQPWLRKETIEDLIRIYMDSDKGMASLTNAAGEYMNPCIFSAEYYEELMSLSGDRGGKAVLMRHTDDVVAMQAAEEELKDVDTPEDLL